MHADLLGKQAEAMVELVFSLQLATPHPMSFPNREDEL